MTDEQWDAMMDVHCKAPFRLIRAAAPHMRGAAKHEIKLLGKAANRCVINISSTSGLHGNVGQASYATAKAGVLGLTKTIAKEWGPQGIRACTVAFGYFDTRLTRAKESGAFQQVGDKKVALGIPDAQRGRVVHGNPLRRAGNVQEAAGGVLFLCSPYASYITGITLPLTGGAGGI
jgi:3-oxoacyl-[acyl-carrier protein] reductase